MLYMYVHSELSILLYLGSEHTCIVLLEIVNEDSN